MVKSFKREAELIVFKRSDNNFPAVKFNKLRISFDFTFDDKVKSNNGKISVYNIHKEARSFYQDQTNLTVILNAGHNGSLSQIFTGDVKLVTTTKEGANTVTTFDCGDGFNLSKNVKISSSFDPGTAVKKMVEQMFTNLKAAGAEIMKGAADLFTGNTKNGVTIQDTALNALNKICRSQNLEIKITNNVVEIIKLNGNIGNNAILLTPNTGLIGTPAKKDKGISFKSLINEGRIFPGRVVKIESSSINGFFVVTKAIYNGDTYGQDWTVNCEARLR